MGDPKLPSVKGRFNPYLPLPSEGPWLPGQADQGLKHYTIRRAVEAGLLATKKERLMKLDGEYARWSAVRLWSGLDLCSWDETYNF